MGVSRGSHTHPAPNPARAEAALGAACNEGEARDRVSVKLSPNSYICLSPPLGGPNGKRRKNGQAGPQGSGYIAPEERGATPKNTSAQIPEPQRASPVAHGSTCLATEKERRKEVQYRRLAAARPNGSEGARRRGGSFDRLQKVLALRSACT